MSVMLRRAGLLELALFLAGCTEKVLLDDVVRDGGPSDLPVAMDSSWSPGDAACGLKYKPLYYQPQKPQIMVLLDRSACMQTSFDGGTRESAAQNALINVIQTYQTRVKFGFEQFPADKTESQCQSGTCCAGSVSVDPILSNLAWMSSSILGNDPRGASWPSLDSPSHRALAVVQDYLSANSNSSTDAPDDQYVLLVTASEPSCTAETPDACCTSARNAASALGNSGVRIVVLSLGYHPDKKSCLYQISQIGPSLQLPANTKAPYLVNNNDDLTTTLTNFVLAVAQTACTLNTTTPPPSQAQLSVSIGLNPIQQTDGNDQDGWYFANPDRTSIKFSGSACDSYVHSQDSLYIAYTCCGASTCY
jgi:hypothetical protein